MSNASDFIIEYGELIKYKGKGGAVVVPDDVISIGAKAFWKKSKITGVVIPEGVLQIGEKAFQGCTGLESVVLPDSVKRIEREAFMDCTNLKQLIAPADVEVGALAVANCTHLADEDGFVIIGSTLCNYYGTGGDIVIPCGVTRIQNSLLDGIIMRKDRYYELPQNEDIKNSITSVAIPEGVTVIAGSTFFHCENLAKAVLPRSISVIGESAFCMCRKLADIVIPESLTRIEEKTFAWCDALKEVVIPETVEYIGPEAFQYCSKLESVTILSENCKVDSSVFFFKTVPLRYPAISKLPVELRPCAALAFALDGGSREDPRFENHIKYIKSNAVKLLDLAIQHPELLALMCQEKLIAAKDIEKFMEAAQKSRKTELTAMLLDYQNSKLTKKQRSSASEKKEQQEHEVFERVIARQNKEGIEGLNFAMTGSLNTFENRAALKAFIESKGGKLLPSITSKVDYLIQNFTISETEKEKKAKELGIEKIDEYRFNELADRVFEIDENGVLLTYRGGENLVVPQGVTRIGISAFGDALHKDGFRLKSATLPDTLQYIHAFAFSDCYNMEQINIPDTVTEIGEHAFSNCRKITQIRIPGKVAVIQESTFATCSALKTVVLEEGITKIAYGVFNYCKSLKEIHIPGSVVQIDPHIFFGRWDLENITIYAPAGSYAETYAKENNIPFVAE